MGGAGVRKEVQKLQGHRGRKHKCVMTRDLAIIRMGWPVGEIAHLPAPAPCPPCILPTLLQRRTIWHQSWLHGSLHDTFHNDFSSMCWKSYHCPINYALHHAFLVCQAWVFFLYHTAHLFKHREGDMHGHWLARILRQLSNILTRRRGQGRWQRTERECVAHDLHRLQCTYVWCVHVCTKAEACTYREQINCLRKAPAFLRD